MASDDDMELKNEIKVVKNATDLQRLKIEKLMKHPEKPVFIPEGRKDKKFPNAPEFVRNVMGSSAGAGSGEFHVYRHIRRREYARQEYLNQCTEIEKLDFEYQQRIQEGKSKEEHKTAKKRAKRQRSKQRIRDKKRNPNKTGKESSSESDEEEDNNEEENSKHKKTDSETNKNENLEPGKKSLKELFDKAKLTLPSV